MDEKSITFDEMMALSKRDFIKRCRVWMKEFNDGKQIKIDDIGKCPVAVYVAVNDLKCHREQVPLTGTCFMCGKPICPDCMNHVVEQVSRVTGYLSSVSGWNAAKRQEFLDRERYNLGE